MPFLLKSVQKVVLFGDPENRSFTSETMKVRDPQEIVTKTKSFLYLWNDKMSHVRLLLDKTSCFPGRTDGRTHAHEIFRLPTQRPLKGQLRIPPLLQILDKQGGILIKWPERHSSLSKKHYAFIRKPPPLLQIRHQQGGGLSYKWGLS